MQVPNPYTEEIFKNFAKDNPDPKTELNYTNLYTLLVAVTLSAQATDASVNKATKELFLKYDNPSGMVELGEEGLKNYIKSIGLYNSKAKNIIALSKILVAKYNGHVPDKFEELITLPGVGRKTANVVMNCWYKSPTMPVDTHVFRVAKRLALAQGNKPEQVEQELLANIPSKWLNNAHHWLVLHGRYVCIARKPKCTICPVNKYCPSREDVITAEVPQGVIPAKAGI